MRSAEPERIRVEVPAVAVASRVPRVVDRRSYRVDPVACTLALGGTLARPTDDDGVVVRVAPRAGRARDMGQQRHVAL